jgi:hypothetical protein
VSIFSKLLTFFDYENYFLDKIKNAANGILLSLQFLALYSQYMAGDPFERLGPTMVFIFMLVGRIVIYFQIQRKEQQLLDAAQAQANGLKQD